MLRLSIPLFMDFEEELGTEKLGNVEELIEFGERFNKHINIIAKVLALLEKHGWKWTSGTRDIILYKDTTKKEAMKEFAELKIPEGVITFD